MFDAIYMIILNYFVNFVNYIAIYVIFSQLSKKKKSYMTFTGSL
jgi:hypothetical protein